MFSIFNRKRRNNDLSWMRVDMHTHLLPGLDDGSTSVAESIDMMRRLQQQGIEQFYGTPHVQDDIYPNDVARIQSSYQQLQASPQLNGMHIDYAAEYNVEKSMLKQVLSSPDTLLPLADKYILLGMSYVSEDPLILPIVQKLLSIGYQPVLANVERYIYYHHDLSMLTKLRDMGCLFQVSLLSCYGYYGSKEKQVVKNLLDKGMIDLLATDVHYERHVKAIEHFVSKQDISGYFASKIKNEELFFTAKRITA